MKTLSASTVVLSEAKALICVANAINLPVLQSHVEPCQGQVTGDPSQKIIYFVFHFNQTYP